MNFYYDASSVLERLNARKGSIKSVVGSLPEKSRKRIAALVIETLKYRGALLQIIENASLLKNERKHLASKYLTLLLVHDLLFAKGGIQAGDGPIKQAVLRHKTRLQAELVKLKIKRGVSSNQELASEGDHRTSQILRYVRVNTNKWTMEEAIAYLSSKGFSESISPSETRTSFARDEHVPDLLCFHPSTKFHDDVAYLSGNFILQDKASCFPALVLAPEPYEDTVTLDAAAAPGNKTTHLSAIMQNKGQVLALERDRQRFTTLQNMISKAGCRNVKAFNLDFLSTDPQASQYAPVTHILLDPSCSGSGIINRLDYLFEIEQDDDVDQGDRVGKLAAFQLKMIKHAMRFPRVVKIVYSTCSIHPVENEQVVTKALDSEEARKGDFTLAPQTQVLPTWTRRGLKEELGSYSDLAECLVRCSPEEDGTNGFFVSCFIREPPAKKAALKHSQNSKRKAPHSLLEENDMEFEAKQEERKTGKKRKRRRKPQPEAIL